ncbi:DNA starvation/stationary phase protection protein Dps [Paludisphaera borealis]|uniref:DNA protection during starvation protein n=1 Tax=Paludisphaera borealis TaxID=1387353 RepID=A0A1U7CQY7_9BACT|nr:DNA starvation/stationary phase protection protein Dps [Paludisphaera borealis]APW61316.1 DNA protection during starvation protein [Paludisphaera borealis]
MHPTRNDLPQDTRAAIVKLLNERLADAIDLQLQAKQAHWNVRGPHFISLHELFDKVSEEVTGFIDVIAERASALGGVAEGTLAAVSSRTTLPAYSLTISDGRDHVDALSKAIAAFGKQARAAIDQADSAGDANTADLFTQVSREVDKQLWFVEAHLEAKR